LAYGLHLNRSTSPLTFRVRLTVVEIASS
jgi:hypothetical protein